MMEELNVEVAIRFYAAFVRTLSQIDAAQPEPGFSSLFMDMLKRNLELGSTAATLEGLDIGQALMDIHRDLLRMFTAMDLGDVLGSDE